MSFSLEDSAKVFALASSSALNLPSSSAWNLASASFRAACDERSKETKEVDVCGVKSGGGVCDSDVTYGSFSVGFNIQ